MNDGLLLVGGALALWLLSKQRGAQTSDAIDREWRSAIFTEYHPDAPPHLRAMEGGPNDRMGNPVITVQQHIADKSKYPYVSVSGDLELRGSTVPYGTRVYFGAYPDYVFRLVDTGGRFRGDKKKIRKPGYEPFDIATEYGSKLGFSGKETVYRIDRSDTLSHRKKPKVA